MVAGVEALWRTDRLQLIVADAVRSLKLPRRRAVVILVMLSPVTRPLAGSSVLPGGRWSRFRLSRGLSAGGSTSLSCGTGGPARPSSSDDGLVCVRALHRLIEATTLPQVRSRHPEVRAQRASKDAAMVFAAHPSRPAAPRSARHSGHLRAWPEMRPSNLGTSVSTRHARPCAGHPRLAAGNPVKAWMAGPSPRRRGYGPAGGTSPARTEFVS